MLYQYNSQPFGLTYYFYPNTELYNSLNNTTSMVLYESDTFSSNMDYSISTAIDYFTTWIGMTGKFTFDFPELTNITDVHTIDNYNSISNKINIHLHNNGTSSEYIGTNYGPINFTITSNTILAELYGPSTSISSSYSYLYKRNYITNDQIWIASVFVVPETAINKDGTIIPANLGTRAIAITLNIRDTFFAIIKNQTATTNTTQNLALSDIKLVIPTSENDPYTDIVPSSGPGGGGGTGDFTGETIGEPSLPSVSALNSGFISAYSPSVASLNALASYMWTTDFSTNLAKVFGDNPMGTILGLSTVPVSPTTGASKSVILGNIDTNIAMPPITAQYTKFNCGNITLQPKYGAFLDYEPYTSIDLFLPYIGLVQLSTNDVMDKSIGVVYTVDVLSGACVANVSCGGTIMYTFEGACATQFPVTNNDYSNVFKSAVDAAASIVGAVGGAVAAGMTGNVAGAVGAIADGAAGAANAAMNAHPVVNRSGSMSGSAGLMGMQKPFIVWTTPNMVASNNQNSFIGYPNFITTSLGSLNGYTEVENINLGIAGATADEVAEIKTLLKNGVIL